MKLKGEWCAVKTALTPWLAQHESQLQLRHERSLHWVGAHSDTSHDQE